MQISSRFTIGVHMLIAIDYFKDNYSVTSNFLAGSIGVNPVIVRQLMQKLTAAGLIAAKRGRGGMHLVKPLNEVTLYDVYKATELVENNQLFHFHENPNPKCWVGGHIHDLLDDKLRDIQLAMENQMKQTTLAELESELPELPADDKSKEAI